MNYKGTKDKLFICKHCNTEFKFKGYSYNHIFCSLGCSYAHQTKQKISYQTGDIKIGWLELTWVSKISES